VTKQKKIMLGALAAIGGILLYARAKKKRDLTNSGVDELQKSFIAYTDESGDLISDDGTSKVNIPNLQKSNVELLKQYGIKV